MIPFQDLKKTNAPLMERLVAAAGNVIRSGRYVNGPEVKAFESELARFTGVRFCVAVSNGLDALRLIMRGYMELGRLNPGDEVIVPDNTFIATFLAVSDCGLVPVPADVDEKTFCLDFNSLPVTPRTRAVIPVHLYGNPCWDDKEIEDLRHRDILVIEDNAQALGATAEGKMTGNLGDAAAVSFYPAKNIGACGDAGAVLTNDEALALAVRKLANYGALEKYHHELCGCNCRMDEIQAALLRIKLEDIDRVNNARMRNARLYDRLITNPDVVKPRFMNGDRTQVWHQYVIRHPRRDALREYLRDNGIGTEIHYPVSCHRQGCYSDRSWGDIPVAERLAGEILSLPIADVTEEDIREVAEIINRFR